ncbi:hypothetical protein, partial [Vibrio genomosp. F10]|uniref:hypothetical protein n=1 Tax=Vibrio genomosp. F10 TaxID=723171 RepID=UPI00114C9864
MRVITLALWLSAMYVHAEINVVLDNNNQIIVDVVDDYTLGANDTLVSAKNISIESAKKTASDYAGSYVESSFDIKNNKLTHQQLRVLSAGFLEVISSKHSQKINDSGSVVLTTNARIKLSKDTIRDGLSKLKNDPERKAQITSLEKDNSRLRSELIALNKSINDGANRTDLMAARQSILNELEKNRETTKQVFAEGTLFQLASLDSNDYELAIRDIDDNFFGHFIHETKLKMHKPKFTKNPNGTYDVFIAVDWNLEKGPVKNILEKYFVVKDKAHSNAPYTLAVRQYDNTGNKQKLQFSGHLNDYLRSKVIVIKIDALYAMGYLPIGHLSGFFGDEEIAYQFSSDSKNNKMLSHSFRNPIIINNLNEHQLKSLRSLNSSVEGLCCRIQL